MLKKMISTTLLSAVLSLPAISPLPVPVEKKLIRFGWGDITADRLANDISALEKNSPFDGVGIVLHGQIPQTGRKITSRAIFGTEPAWKYS